MVRGGFWRLGPSLLIFAYVCTVFDPEITTPGEDSAEDKFEVATQTADQIYIIRPILRPVAFEPIQTEVGNRRAQISDDVTMAFLSVEEATPEEIADASPIKDYSDIPTRLQKSAVTPKMTTPIHGEDASLTSSERRGGGTSPFRETPGQTKTTSTYLGLW